MKGFKGSGGRLLGLVGLLGALAPAAMGCSPDSKYRKVALIPAARPYRWDGRTAEGGSVRMSGHISTQAVHKNPLPKLGDSAFRVPNTTLEGSAHVAVVDNLEMGVRYAHSESTWAVSSAQGTVPLANADPVTGFGVDTRLMIPLTKDKRFGLGLALSVMSFSVPYASWTRVNSCQGVAGRCVGDTSVAGLSNGIGFYRLDDSGTKNPMVWQWAIYPSYQLGADGGYGHVFGGLSAHSNFQNDGFTNDPDGEPLEGAGFFFHLTAGYGIKRGPLRANLAAGLPLSNDLEKVSYGVSFGASLSLELDVFGPGPSVHSEPRNKPKLTTAEPEYF